MSGVRLPRPLWEEYAAAHRARADALTADHRERRAQGRSHPVADFLFVYYQNSPARLARWHPGPGVVLEDALAAPQAQWRHYRSNPDGSVELEVASFVAQRGSTLAFVRKLLTATLARPAHTACFGLHEWAMVYRLSQDEVRHASWPLRLGPDGTDEVVRQHAIRCTHYDAFRFFTPQALSRNAVQPTREGEVDLEQPGCLHAGMDVYKWAYLLAPLVPGDLLLDAFELAADIRVLDMRASPYDLTELGLSPLPIETREGKTAYAEAQRAFTVRSNDLRRRLLTACEAVLGSSAMPTDRLGGHRRGPSAVALPQPPSPAVRTAAPLEGG